MKVRTVVQWALDALIAVVVGSEAEYHRRRFNRAKHEAERDKQDADAHKRWTGK